MRYLQGYDQIFLVSDSLHVHRGKRYFCRQAPCDQVQTISYYQPLDRPWWKVSAALLELHDWIRDIAIYERNAANNAPPCAI